MHSEKMLRPILTPFLLLCLVPSSHADTSAVDNRPNVILVSLDTLRADHLSLYGYERETSPNLNRIAQESIVFDMAIAQASSTNPSHASLFLSRFASTSRRNMPMLAEILKKAGYATAAFTGGGNVSAKFGFGAGFDSYFESRKRRPNGGKRTFEETMPEIKAWLAEPKVQPFFLFIHSFDIHHPYDAPEPFGTYFCGDYDGPVDGNASTNILKKIRRMHQFRDFTGEVNVSDADRHQIIALYDGGILYADSYLGEIEKILKKNNLWDNTLFIVLSDHGEEFWDHGSVLHSHTVYQELVRVPLLIRLPGGRLGGQRIENPTPLLDVTPTILDQVGLRPAPSHLGTSLIPRIQQKGAKEPTVIVSEMGALRGTLFWPIKAIRNVESGASERFNLETDPSEQANITGREGSQVEEPDLLGQVEVLELETIPDDEVLKEQLRALGYIE